MARRSRGGVASSPLRRVQANFHSWRKTRSRGARIPRRLWDSAVQVAMEVGVCRTAKALKLDYYKLQRLASKHGKKESSSVSFVEIPGVTSPVTSECVIELEDSSGASMRVTLKGADAETIVSLGSQLWKEG